MAEITVNNQRVWYDVVDVVPEYFFKNHIDCEEYLHTSKRGIRVSLDGKELVTVQMICFCDYDGEMETDYGIVHIPTNWYQFNITSGRIIGQTILDVFGHQDGALNYINEDSFIREMAPIIAGKIAKEFSERLTNKWFSTFYKYKGEQSDHLAACLLNQCEQKIEYLDAVYSSFN